MLQPADKCVYACVCVCVCVFVLVVGTLLLCRSSLLFQFDMLIFQCGQIRKFTDV